MSGYGHQPGKCVVIMSADDELLIETRACLPDTGLRLRRVPPLDSSARMRWSEVGVILIDSPLGDETWKQVLTCVCQPNQIPLIVASRHADDQLWCEVLNWGGYDLLAQPLDRGEVERVITSALRRSSSKPSLLAAHGG